MTRGGGERDLGVFVPAIMGAGLLFSLSVLVLDGVEQVIGRRHRATVSHAQARTVVALTRGDSSGVPSRFDPSQGRRTLMILAAVCLGAALYVAPGAWFNYVRPHGYLDEVAWVLALALAMAVTVGVVGVVLGASALRPDRWSTPARRALWAAERLTRHPDAPPLHRTWGRRWHGTASAVIVLLGVAGGMWTLAVAMNARILHTWDVRWADMLDRWDGRWRWTEPLGRTEVAVAVAVVAAVVGWRRAPRMVVAHGAAVATGVVVNVVVKAVVDRPRPVGASAATALASYPSGHVLQAVVLAVFVTAWMRVLLGRRALTSVAGVALGSGALLCAVARVTEAAHWPSDVVGGALLGGTVASVAVLAAQPRTLVGSERLWLRLPSGVVVGARRLARLMVVVAVVVVAVLMITVGVPADPEATLGTERLQQALQLALLGLVVVAWLVSWRFEALGAALLAVAGTVMAWFAALQYRPTVAIVIAVAFLAPALLLWLSWQHGQSLRSLVTLAVTTTALVSAVWVGASTVHDRYFGPTHPASSVVLPAPDEVRWIWTGGLSPNGFRVVAGVRDVDQRVEFLVATDSAFTQPTVLPATVQRAERGVVGAAFDTAEPGRTYHVAVRVEGRRDDARTARVRTPLVGPQSFRVAFASCARTGSNGAVYDAIAEVDPLLYVITGDAHYGDVATDDPGRLLDVWERTLTAPAQQALYAQVAVAYVWDDHDYGGNDSDASSSARAMAQQVYRDLVPHSPLPRVDDIGQSFVIGRVRFVLTDTRSHRQAADDGSGTLLGAAQQAWLIDEARAARRAGELLVWVSPTPWIGAASPASDTWAGFADERRRVADALVDAGVDDLVMLAGDAHMVAIDDGTHSGYATGGGGGFPVAHGSALDRRGSVKGGPYSEGTFPGGGQFGVMEVVDDGGPEIEVTLSGRTWRGDTLVSFTRSFTLTAAAAVTDSASG